MKKSSKNRLMPHQQALFPHDTLFDKIARAVCRAGVLPRKELYEAWETAKRVRRRFRGGRVVDLACGHGLLAHIMLLLDDSSNIALAVDKTLPPSAHKLSRTLTDAWPRLEGRVIFRASMIDEVIIESGDLVVSAHACGALTDQIIEMAMEPCARLAVLPCCHDASSCEPNGLEAWMDVSLAIDTARVFKLKSMGYRVWAQQIPSDITPKNRLILGEFVSGRPQIR